MHCEETQGHRHCCETQDSPCQSGFSLTCFFSFNHIQSIIIIVIAIVITFMCFNAYFLENPYLFSNLILWVQEHFIYLVFTPFIYFTVVVHQLVPGHSSLMTARVYGYLYMCPCVYLWGCWVFVFVVSLSEALWVAFMHKKCHINIFWFDLTWFDLCFLVMIGDLQGQINKEHLCHTKLFYTQLHEYFHKVFIKYTHRFVFTHSIYVCMYVVCMYVLYVYTRRFV